MFKKDLRKKEDFFPKIVFWQSNRRIREDCKFRIYNTTNGEWSGGQISWDQNSLFHEVKIKFVHEIELFCHFSWGQNS